MKKLAVFFPGIGYTVDKPLLYYSRKLASQAGFEVRLLSYTGFPQNARGDREQIRNACELALARVKEQLSGIDLSACGELLFVGKSVGTYAAAGLAAEISAPDRIRLLLYTPLEETFVFPFIDAVVFTGSADPWTAKGSIPELCHGRGIPCTLISQANHSLETGNVKQDLRNLEQIMSETKRFIKASGREK